MLGLTTGGSQAMTEKNGLPMRSCDECRKDFDPNTSWQHYCSPSCRNKAAWKERKAGMHLIRQRKVKV